MVVRRSASSRRRCLSSIAVALVGLPRALAHEGHFDVRTGKPLADFEGRTLVVHDVAGVRIACSVVEKEGASSMHAHDFEAYPGYTGGYRVTGVAELGQEGDGVTTLQFDLKGTDHHCVGHGSGVANSCGVHVFSGKTCSDVQGHFFDDELEDPWGNVTYVTGASEHHRHVHQGKPLDDNKGKPVVIYDHMGHGIACALLAFAEGDNAHLEARAFAKYPGYEGPLNVAGVVTVGIEAANGHEDTVLSFMLKGTCPNCKGDATDVPNACGVQIHSGSACGVVDSIGGTFYKEGEPDPWPSVRYVTGASTKAVLDELDHNGLHLEHGWSGEFEVPAAGHYTLTVEKNSTTGDYAFTSMKLLLGSNPASKDVSSMIDKWEHAEAVKKTSGDSIDVDAAFTVWNLTTDAESSLSYYVINVKTPGHLLMFFESDPHKWPRRFPFLTGPKGAPVQEHEQDHDHDHGAGGDHDHDHGAGGDHDHDHGAGGDHDHDHGAGGDHDHDHGAGTGVEAQASESAGTHVSKGFAILIIIGSAVLGVWLRLRCPALDSPRLFSYINVLTGGMFIGMGLFHILPETIEHQPTSMATMFTTEPSGMGVTFFVFFGFSLVLLFERVIFDAHAHSHGEDEAVENEVKGMLNARTSLVRQATSQEVGGEARAVAPRRSFGREAASSLMASMDVGGVELQGVAPGGAGSSGHGHGDGHGLGHDTEHGHSAEDHQHQGDKGGVGAIMLMVALSVHSLFEGIVIGTAKSASTVWLLTSIVVAHKWAAAFAIASQLTPQQRASRTAIVLLSIFCLASPLGATLGWIVDAFSEAASSGAPAFIEAMLNSLAVGTLFYIGFVEVVPEEFTGTRYAFSKFGTLVLSAMVVFGLTVLHMQYGHSHDHAEGAAAHDHAHRL